MNTMNVHPKKNENVQKCVCTSRNGNCERWYLQWITSETKKIVQIAQKCNRSWYCDAIERTLRDEIGCGKGQKTREREKMALNLHVTFSHTLTMIIPKSNVQRASKQIQHLFNAWQFQSSNEFRKFHLMSCNRLTCVFVYVCLMCIYSIFLLLRFSLSLFFFHFVHMKCSCEWKLNEYLIQSNWNCTFRICTEFKFNQMLCLKCCLASNHHHLCDTFNVYSAFIIHTSTGVYSQWTTHRANRCTPTQQAENKKERQRRRKRWK